MLERLPTASALEADRLTVRYREPGGKAVEALRDVSGTFRPGSLTAIVGPSGSGKSTLLHCLAGILVPTDGEVRLDDRNVSGLSETARDAWRRRHCGLVFQDFRLLDELNVVENVLVPALFDSFVIPRALRERAGGLLADFGVPARRGSVSRLSRGERQRVALARALLMDPPIILADEPTASLDRESAASIVAALQRLAGQGKALVCVTHDEALAACAHERIVLRGGRMGAPAEDAGRRAAGAVS